MLSSVAITAICANLLHFYPSTSPVQIAVGDSVAFTCQAESPEMALLWWQDNTRDRVILSGETSED